MACVEKADKNTGAKTAQRFQYRGLGAVFALHTTLGNLGIEIFPLKGVFDAFKVAHESGQEFIARERHADQRAGDPVQDAARLRTQHAHHRARERGWWPGATTSATVR